MSSNFRVGRNDISALFETTNDEISFRPTREFRSIISAMFRSLWE